MDRRQFLQTLNASSVGAFLPVSAFLNGNPLNTTQAQLPFPVDENRSVQATASAWDGPKIGIVSVGGISRIGLPSRGNPDVKFPHLIRSIAVDSYSTEFNSVIADFKVQLDDSVFDPHDAGTFPEATLDEIAEAVARLDMVILVAGMGGTTGSTASLIIAAHLKKLEVLTLAVAVMPFAAEGPERHKLAEMAVQSLRGNVNALLPVLNDEFDVFDVEWKSHEDRLLPKYVDSVYSTIVNPLCVPGWVNVEFADVRDHIFNQSGICALGRGLSSAEDAAQQAAMHAMEHPALGESSLQQARSVLLSLEHGRDVLPHDIQLAIRSVRTRLSPECHFLYGISVVDSLGEMVQVNVLANGFTDDGQRDA